MTGHGGYLQTLTHGYTGYRSNLDVLYLDPNLPPQLNNYTIKGFKWHSSSFDIQIDSKQTTITRKSGGNDSVTIQIASGNEKAGSQYVRVEMKPALPPLIDLSCSQLPRRRQHPYGADAYDLGQAR